MILLFAIYIISFSACGQIIGSSDNNNGSIKFSVRSEGAEQIDCGATGISTIEGEVYDSSNVLIKLAGPWNCSDISSQESITITDIPPGSNNKLTIRGKNSSGTIIYTGSNTGINVVGNGTYNAGSVTLVHVDTNSAPANGAVIINNSTNFTTSASVTLSLSATDDSAVAAYYASETSTAPTAESIWIPVASAASYSADISFTLSSGNGLKTVYVWFRDNDGTISSLANDTIILDDTISNGTVIINSGAVYATSTTVNLSLSATDDTGITAYYTSETSASPTTNALGWTSVTSTTNFNSDVSFTLSGANGLKNVYIWFKDGSGNISDTSGNDSIFLDDTIAQGTISINSGSVSANAAIVTLSLTATDDTGIIGYYASETATIPGASDSGWTSVTEAASYSKNVPFTLSSGDGEKTVYVWFKDSAGNVSTSDEDTILLEITVISSLFTVPDTGQTTSYTDTFGEDSDYTINTPSYTDNGNETITDNVTGLIWQQQDDDVKYSMENAASYCGDLTLAGNTDWRLPSYRELLSIVDRQRSDPSINTTYFLKTNSTDYWSSTTYANNELEGWVVYFYYGYTALHNKTNTNYARCVYN